MSGNTPEWVRRASVGDVVVCIDTTSPYGYGRHGKWSKFVSVGSAYIIREIAISADFDQNPHQIGFRLNGITLPDTMQGEGAFWWGWFRPADTTDLPESLTEILTRTNPVQWKEAENV